MAKLKKKIALIFGVTGKDGSYLAEYLLEKNYVIHGVKRRSSSANTQRIDHLHDSVDFSNKNFFIHYGDVTDSSSTINLINAIKPDEIYNLAAQSHVKVSFDIPEYTANSTALGTLRILEALRFLKMKKTKYYQASSSEMFGKQPKNKSQDENTKFHPMSIYGVSKVFAFHTSVFYREAYGMHTCNGILFNHESPRRGPTFVTKKIIQALVRIKLDKQKILTLGNLYSVRDWGHAKDYARSMWKIMQYKKPDDWVIATNQIMNVKQFVTLSSKKLGIKIDWKHKNEKEIGVNKKTGKTIVKIDKKFFRPGEVEFLKGNFNKAKKLLKWKPSYNINQLIDEMINYELKSYE